MEEVRRFFALPCWGCVEQLLTNEVVVLGTIGEDHTAYILLYASKKLD